jgi:hypothetical protein
MEKKEKVDPFAFCYLQSKTIKTLSLVSPAFLKLFFQNNVFLPYECMGVLFHGEKEKGKDVKTDVKKDVKKEKEGLLAKPVSPTRDPTFSDSRILKSLQTWFSFVQLCFQQNRITTFKEPILILHGDSGVGKSFLLHHFANEYKLQVVPLSLSDADKQLETLSSYSSIQSFSSNGSSSGKARVFHLQDVLLLDNNWLCRLLKLYQQCKLKTPIVIEVYSQDYYQSRWNGENGRKHSIHSFFRLQPFAKSISIYKRKEDLSKYLRWKSPNSSKASIQYILDCLAYNSNFAFAKANLLLEESPSFSPAKQLGTYRQFHSLFDLGKWLFERFPVMAAHRRAFEWARDASYPLPATQLALFFQRWIEFFADKKDKEKSSSCAAWGKELHERLLKTESALTSLAIRKGWLEVESEVSSRSFTKPEDNYWIDRIHSGDQQLRFRPDLQIRKGVNLFLQSKDEATTDLDLNLGKVEKEKSPLDKKVEQKANRDLLILDKLAEFQSDSDAYPDIFDKEDGHDVAGKAMVFRLGQCIGGLSAKKLPYKDIMNWFHSNVLRKSPTKRE